MQITFYAAIMQVENVFLSLLCRVQNACLVARNISRMVLKYTFYYAVLCRLHLCSYYAALCRLHGSAQLVVVGPRVVDENGGFLENVKNTVLPYVQSL
jgi:hypothetical protein